MSHARCLTDVAPHNEKRVREMQLGRKHCGRVLPDLLPLYLRGGERRHRGCRALPRFEVYKSFRVRSASSRRPFLFFRKVSTVQKSYVSMLVDACLIVCSSKIRRSSRARAKNLDSDCACAGCRDPRTQRQAVVAVASSCKEKEVRPI